MAVIQVSGERNALSVLRRTMNAAWFGMSVANVAQAPAILNAESITGVNAAGTGTVNLIGVNASDQVTINGDVAIIRIHPTFTLDAAQAVSRAVFVALVAYQFAAVSISWGTASSSGTFTVEKLTGTTAPGSGTALLTGTISTAGTANTVTAGTLIATVSSLQLAIGDRIGFVFSGTETGLVGLAVTLSLKRI